MDNFLELSEVKNDKNNKNSLTKYYKSNDLLISLQNNFLIYNQIKIPMTFVDSIGYSEKPNTIVINNVYLANNDVVIISYLKMGDPLTLYNRSNNLFKFDHVKFLGKEFRKKILRRHHINN